MPPDSEVIHIEFLYVYTFVHPMHYSYMTIGRSRANIYSRRRPLSSNIQISRMVASSPRSSSAFMSTLASSPRRLCSKGRPLELCKFSLSLGSLHTLIFTAERCSSNNGPVSTPSCTTRRPSSSRSASPVTQSLYWQLVSPVSRKSLPSRNCRNSDLVFFSMFVATIPAVLYVDKLGRKPILISGAFLMAACHIIVAILTSLFHDSWDTHSAAGWGACALVWVFAVGESR